MAAKFHCEYFDECGRIGHKRDMGVMLEMLIAAKIWRVKDKVVEG